uniref:C2H2-type domain-containing protein n=1 Tax=Amphiprion percula TaxID=161767 RepID=A0A3P8SZN5_AMPPE
MQNDSTQFSTSCRIKQVSKQAVPQGSLVKSFQCSHCILIFKSKVYLFEHLNKVHGFDVDTALTEAGLKYIKTDKANTDNSTSSSGSNFKCQHCDFKAFSQDILNEHEEQCEKKTENRNLLGTAVLSENPDTAITEILPNQHDETTEAKEISSVTSTSKTKSSLNPVKDLKTYKRPLQTITKYFTASSGSDEKPTTKLADGAKGTLILQDSPSSSSPNSSGVFKVTAKSMIDLSNAVTDHFLRNEQLLMTDLSPSKPKAQLSETPPNNTGKRPNRESSESRPAKKAKSDKEVQKLPNKEHTSDQLSLSSTKFSFDISEDEEENMGDSVHGDTDVYCCKHCDFSGVGIKILSAHYQDNHPYVRYNAVYIQDINDQSATFRCLECPVKFLSTADLKGHYMENHPNAPDVFMMKASQLNMVFKCFVCPFTTSTVRDLREHYKVKHPAHRVESSLFFCRYSVTEGQEEPSSCNICEKTASSERSGEMSPERSHIPCAEDKNATSPQHATSNGADMALFKCKICKFSHKSVVVMHVHYQKSHPDEEITLQKIKQSTCAMSEMTPEKSPNSGTVTEGSAPLKNISGASEDKAEVSQQKKILSFLEKPEYKAETSEHNSESSDTKKVESVKDRRKRKKFSTKYDWEISAGMDSLSSSSPDKIFYCQFCNYTSPSVRSVVGHHNAKHSMDAPVFTDDIVLYSAEKQKMKLEMKPSKSPPSSHSKTTTSVEACSETKVQNNEEDKTDASVAQLNPYACADNLFYCQKCNFGNPTPKGVINHQAKAHQHIHTCRESVVEYTALVRDEIEKSKHNDKELSFCTGLPLPLMNEGDEYMFFCHYCNYRNNTVKEVMRHYSKTHRGFEKNSTQVQQYTSMVLQRTQKLHLKLEQEVSQESPGKLESSPKKIKEFAKSSPVGALQRQRTLRCYRCTYSTPYVYLLKRHIRKAHLTIHSVTDVLRVCFKQGALQSGYHCEFCIFSGEDAAAVYKHYQEKHPSSKTSFGHISKLLYVGPDTDPPKTKKPKLKHTDGIRDGDGHDGNLTSQRRQRETETYSCSSCSYKSSSMLSVARHYRAVHPLPAKEDHLDILNSTKTSSQKEDHDEIPELFDSYQVPLEFDKSSDEATFKCPYCALTFNTRHGVSVHCGMKHHEAEPKDLEEKPKPPVQIETSLHIFKCPYCTYVNTVHQGVLTHCQMKHPTLPSKAGSLNVDLSYVRNWDEGSKKNGPGDIVRFSGHLCETCPQLCATLNKLSKHREMEHNDTAASNVQSTLKPSAVSKITISKSYSTQRSVSKVSLLSKKINAMVRCQQCSYTCRTKIELSQHLRVHHKNTIPKDRVYKCVLCSKIYFMTKRLAGHYAKKHGREAYLKYYIPMYKQGFEKPAPTSPDPTSTQQPENSFEPPKLSITTDGNKILFFSCPSCPYVNASYHGTLTHCQMKHPDVVARADELKTTEILLSNTVRCTIGRSANQRGYMCQKCPQIHGSMAKLRIHYIKTHDELFVFEHSAETTENQPDYDSQASVLKAVSLKEETSEVKITETEDCPQPDTSETCQSNSPSPQSQLLLYKCHMCSYAGSCRKYLHCHLRKTHKLDALTTYRLLEKYNIRKRKMPSDLPVPAEPEESANVKCKMCPDLMFDSPQLLIDHYNTFHRFDCKLDFTVLSLGSKKSKTTGTYKCSHCATVLYGIRKLCPHLDRHAIGGKDKTKAARRKTSLVITPKPEIQTVQFSKPDELPKLETLEDLTQWNMTPVQTFTLPTSPLPSPSKPTDVEQTELESRQDKHACEQCGRTFMSMKGLRSHVRSHAALAAIKKLSKPSTSALKININKFVIHKSGTVKPFLCGLCSYRTTVLGLWRSHFMKKHKDVIEDPAETHCEDEENAQRTDRESSYSSEAFINWSEYDEETEMTEESMYLEPPDVQRQLNHYNLMAQSNAKSKVNVHESKLAENSVFYCEMCNFNTEHLSSMRRHYINRHGKRIFKCKDCNFFTGSRKTLEMHIETGHSTGQSEPTHQKDLRCPFCLYQTSNKNNMIDHIVLHREERVVPIEVRRSKLSRYLQGIVFRCHKCTFSSGSAENLRLHMTRHDDIKPYKCRLCYFDCVRLSDLEAHLSDKHQVVRNHELVGQVSLDQLDASAGGMPGNEEEHSSNLEEHNSDTDNVETKDFITDFSETENPTGNNTRDKIMLKEAGLDGNEENPGDSRQHENTKLNTTVLEKTEQEPQKQAVTDTARGNAEKNVGERNNGPEEEGQTNKNRAQPRLKDSEASSISEQKEEAAEGSSTPVFQTPEKTQAHMLHTKTFQHRTQNIEAKIEKDIIRHILQLDNDGSICKIHKTTNHNGSDKTEQNIEAKGVDNDLGDIPLLDEEGNGTLVQNPKHQVNAQTVSASAKMNHTQAKNTTARESFTIERHLLTLSPNCTELLLSHKDSLGVTSPICKQQEMNSLKNCEEVTEHYGEMPVLENEYLKHGRPALGCYKEHEETDPLNQKEDKESAVIAEDNGKQCKDLDDPHVHKGAVTAIDGSAEVLRSSLTEDKPFKCKLCGRNLMNSSELKRHIMRHGI